MANADGSVIIKADIDDKQAQKELNALEKKIEALQENIFVSRVFVVYCSNVCRLLYHE